VVREAANRAPTSPGIYCFLGPDGELLYVGKARHLRRRLQQHARSADEHPRTAKLHHLTTDVRWEELPTESAAAAREADLVVALRPRFNAAISGEGRWTYVCVDDGLRLGPPVKEAIPGTTAYGCFPHLGPGGTSPPAADCNDGYAALRRLAEAAALTKSHRRGLHHLLSGTSSRLLDELFDLAATDVDAYRVPALRRDRDTARRFYDAGPVSLRALRLRHHVAPGPLTKDEVQELIRVDLESSIGAFRLSPPPDEADLIGPRRDRRWR
jgi:predicted GIY-YIG superfamily endonuclease